MNGVLMELGFLKRIRESPYWPRVGWIYGTSAGALAGTLAAVDRLDDLEEFLLRLRPEETFRPHRLWQLPLLGLHDYVLPQTIETRSTRSRNSLETSPPPESSSIVVATDVTQDADEEGTNPRELAYSSHETPPEIFGQAVLASAAISALVLPLRVGDRIATDGGWVRNYPLGSAYEQPGGGDHHRLPVPARVSAHGCSSASTRAATARALQGRPARARIHRGAAAR